jgi:acetyl esterase
MSKLVLNEQARAHLEGRVPQPPFWERDIADVRREMREECLAAGGVAEPMASVDELSVGGVPSRLYRPLGGERNVTLWFHGGAWMLGDLDCHDSLVRALANRARCAFLAIDYGLAPEHPFPAGIEDAWAATVWASSRFERVAVGGDSAGGNLAAVVALRCRDGGIPLAHQLLVYPVLDYAVDSDFYREFRRRYRSFGPGDYGTESCDGMRRVWEVYVPDPAQRVEPDAAPMRAASLAGVAPATIITAEHDILRGEAERYAERLQAEGVEVEVINYESQLHGFFHLLGRFDDARDAVERAAAAIRRWFDS